MNKTILFILLFCSITLPVYAESALTIDRAVASDFQLAFLNNENIQPEISDFDITNFVLMSSENGERWAVITFTNTSSGSRILQKNQIMALLANAQWVYPLSLEQKFDGHESISLTLSFGINKFPILQINTRKI